MRFQSNQKLEAFFDKFLVARKIIKRFHKMYCKPLNVISFALLPILIELVQSSFNKFLRYSIPSNNLKVNFINNVEFKLMNFQSTFYLIFPAKGFGQKHGTATKS